MELPKELKNTIKGLHNIQNYKDETRFMWSVLGLLHPASRRAERIDKYVRCDGELNMNGMSYPVPAKSVDRFERHNPSISTNVFGHEDKKLFPLCI